MRTLLDRHVRNDPLNGILPLLLVLAVKVGREFKVLAFTWWCAEAGHRTGESCCAETSLLRGNNEGTADQGTWQDETDEWEVTWLQCGDCVRKAIIDEIRLEVRNSVIVLQWISIWV